MATTTMATMAILNNTKGFNPKPKAPILIPKAAGNLSTKPVLPLLTSTALAGAFFSALGSCEPAVAAQQVAQIADAAAAGGDNRGLALLLPIVPAIGWVLFNILQPALNQLNRMRSEKAMVFGAGLAGLAWAAAPQSSEAAEAAAAAGGDNRGTLLLIVILPAIGWVLFNILQPALNQLNRMRSD